MSQVTRQVYVISDLHIGGAYGNPEDPNDRGYDAIRRLFLLVIAELSGEFRRAPDLSHESQPDRQTQI